MEILKSSKNEGERKCGRAPVKFGGWKCGTTNRRFPTINQVKIMYHMK
jgi:hypothetical protein